MLLQLILESREEFVANQLGPKLTAAFNRDRGRKPSNEVTPLLIVQHVSQAGPKYVQWLARQYAAGQFLWEDLPQVRADIMKYEQLKRAHQLPSKDINVFKTLKDLRTTMRDQSVGSGDYSTKMEKLYQGLVESVKTGHGKWIHNNQQDPIKIYVPTDEAGSVAIRKVYPDIKWCTTHEEDWETLYDELAKTLSDEQTEEAYREWKSRGSSWNREEPDWSEVSGEFYDEIRADIKRGKYKDEIRSARENQHDYYLETYGGQYYVILTPEGPFQFHFESGQFKDQEDEDVNFHALVSKYPTIRKILSPIVADIGHPHFDIEPESKVSTREQAVKALLASWENIGHVNSEQLTTEDWEKVLVNTLKKQGGGRDDYNNIRDAYKVFNNVANEMKKANYSYDDVGEVISQAIKQLPRLISVDQIPNHLANYVKGVNNQLKPKGWYN